MTRTRSDGSFYAQYYGSKERDQYFNELLNKLTHKETETMNELTATAVPVLTGAATLSDDTKAIVDSLAAGAYQIGNMLAKSSWGDDIILKRNPHTSEYDKEFRINESLVSEMNDLVRVVKGLSQSREGACTAQWATQSLLERKED